MAGRIFICECGHKTRISDEIITKAYTCPMCGQRQAITDKNTVSSEAALFEEEQPDDAAPAFEDLEPFATQDDDEAWAPPLDAEGNLDTGLTDVWSDRWQPSQEPSQRRIADDDPRERPDRIDAFDPSAPPEEPLVNAFTARPDEPAEPPRSSREACARCGRVFRGDWDRNPTDNGILCHICINLATEEQPAPRPRTNAPPISPMPHASGMPIDDLGGGDEFEPVEMEKAPKADVPRFAEDHPDAFRIAILLAGLLVIGLAIFFNHFHESEMPTRSEEELAQQYEYTLERLQASVLLRVLVFSVASFARALTLVVTIMLAILWDEDRPFDSHGEMILYFMPLFVLAVIVGVLDTIFVFPIDMLLYTLGYISIWLLMFFVYSFSFRAYCAYLVIGLFIYPLGSILTMTLLGLITIVFL